MEKNRGGVVAAGAVSDRVVATYTRPSNTTQYTARDALADSTTAPTALTFADCGRINGGTGLIVSAQLVTSTAAATAGEFELWLFSESPTGTNDNAAFGLSDADSLLLLGVIVFDTAKKGANNAHYQADPPNIVFECASDDTDLYGLVVVANAYTPASAEQFRFVLGIVQD